MHATEREPHPAPLHDRTDPTVGSTTTSTIGARSRRDVATRRASEVHRRSSHGALGRLRGPAA
jgi:hypothetical protein